jgi:hypothetical protein
MHIRLPLTPRRTHHSINCPRQVHLGPKSHQLATPDAVRHQPLAGEGGLQGVLFLHSADNVHSPASPTGRPARTLRLFVFFFYAVVFQWAFDRVFDVQLSAQPDHTCVSSANGP